MLRGDSLLSRLRASWVPLVVVAILSGCAAATPDFKPFANETAALSAGIAAEQAVVLTRYGEVIGRTTSRDPSDGRVQRLESQKESYEATAKALNVVLETAVTYSATLVELGEAGESGPQAVESLTNSLKGMGDAIGVAVPVASLVPKWVDGLVKGIATEVTRVQAQKTLFEATKVAQPAVEKIADTLSSIYSWPRGEQAGIVTSLQSTEEGVILDTIGNNRVAFYRGLSVDIKQSPNRETRQTRLEWFFGDLTDQISNQEPAAGICGLPGNTGSKDRHCLTGQTAQSLEALVNLVAGIEPQFQAYLREVAASRKWLEQRKAASAPIAAAAKAWAAEHAKLARKLEECGNRKFFDKPCGGLTFANLRASVDRLRALAGKGGD